MDLSNENVIHVKKENIEYLQFRRLLEYKDKLIHAFTITSGCHYIASKHTYYLKNK